MTVLLWWLIPLVATFLAVAFVALRNRPSKPVDAAQGMADLERFRAAMAKPLPADRAVRPREPGDVVDGEVPPHEAPAPHRRTA